MKRQMLMIPLFLTALPVLADSTPNESPRHLTARSCEIFLDKIRLNAGSFGFRSVTLYVKTRNQQLDGDVVEVGYRHRCANTQNDTDGCVGDWHDEPLKPYLGTASDYWELSPLTLASWNRGTNEYDGAFYVRTNKNTWVWAHAQHDDNFIVNVRTWDWLANLVNFPNVDTVPTQQGGVSQVFNPQKCY